MKRFYIVSICLLPFIAKAQSFPTENVQWTVLHEQISSYDPKILHNFQYAPRGDTLINDKTFTKLYRSDGALFDSAASSYVGAYLAQESQVFFIAKDSLEARILYDFDIEPGWLLSIHSQDTMQYFQLKAIDTIILSDNVPRRRYHFYLMNRFSEGEPESYWHHSWIEGIGSTIGFFPDPSIFYQHYLPVDPLFSKTLLCFKENGILLYSDEVYFRGNCFRETLVNSTDEQLNFQEIQVFPNPSSGLFYLNRLPMHLDTAMLRVLDLNGLVKFQKRIDELENQEIDLSNFPGGLYLLQISDRNRKNLYRHKLIKIDN